MIDWRSQSRTGTKENLAFVELADAMGMDVYVDGGEIVVRTQNAGPA